MKPTKSVTIATWMLEHLIFGPNSEALSGDLLEEVRRGRSVGWYQREVVSAIGFGILQRSRDYALPLIFSTAWSMLYPAWWFCLVTLPPTQAVFKRCVAIDLPYSSALQSIGGIIPAVIFVWLGLFVYLMLRTHVPHRLPRLRLFASLSISLNTLLLTTIGLSMHLKSSGISLSYMTREDFYFNSHQLAICIPLALSLLSAIASALPRPQHHSTVSVAD